MTQKNLFINFRIVPLLMALFVAGCSASPATPDYTNQMMDFSAVRSVAVLPLQNLSEYEEADERVRDAFMGMLLATEAIYVLPPGEVARGINRVGLNSYHSPMVEEVVELGKVLEVDAVITGVLREYGPVRSGAAEANMVSLSLNMLETQRGTTVWSASSTKGGITLADRMLGSGGKPMNDVTTQVIDDLLDQLFE